MIRALWTAFLVAIPALAAGPERVPGYQPMALVSSVAPRYPEFASAHRLSADIVLSAMVQADGHVSHVRVVSGPAMFHYSAIRAVSQWTYRPAAKNGKPVAGSTLIRLSFRTR